MRAENFDYNKIVETLQGTCTENIQSALDYHYPGMDEEDLTDEDHTMINMDVFLCDTCNWWCEACEECLETDECGNGVCEDCCKEEHEDE